MKWRDYDIDLDKEIDSWILPSFSKNADLINTFAFFNEPVSKEYHWYKTHPLEMSNIADYFKVVEIDNEPIALFIFNYYKDDYGRLVLGINPMAIHPKKINKGYGTIVLADLIANTEEIMGQMVEIIYAGIDEKNIISTKVFKKFGFKEVGRTDDKEFVYYELNKRCKSK
ncbi:GNAT family N-acetyltransferase [Lederbergia sp. NSJ-179]|uniref:GNAT family N-acetyltransferase n=1 Tax=Lederbergia sp. NSJ-179 TaxID=2931402 RepID=UPI001FD3592B|nr:GNAT family N-acetyltransferase [Lederbergia sp. NSJ-179]MCJ7842301.1 GNAT family N-acetyltransferase [Lederbergia sp. NSJ-179]